MSNKLMPKKLVKISRTIPVFFAIDDTYVKYFMVSLRSLIDHTSKYYKYEINILNTDISEYNQNLVKQMEKPNVSIRFHDVSKYINGIKKKLALRDYYSLTTYYRIFIAEMFPEYDTVLYLDSDTIILKNIASLFRYNLGDHYVGAIQDVIIKETDLFSTYSEKVLGISRLSYFNAGVLIINCEQFRKNKVKNQFIKLVNTYTFGVAQDQDYLNIICQNKVLWIDSAWNVQMSEKKERPLDSISLIHYNFAEKPWHYKDIRYADVFWKYASQTAYYIELEQLYENFNDSDKARDINSGENLRSLATSEISRMDNYYNIFGYKKSVALTRAEILEKIKVYEMSGRFDVDVENDPEGRELLPGDIDYLRRWPDSKLKSKYAFRVAHWYVRELIKKNQLIIKEIKGLENFTNLNTGAIITCNHFHPNDSFAMQLVYEKSGQYSNKKKMFRVISETNYTSFPGFFGFIMRNCDTLPLSSNSATMKKFLSAVGIILQNKHFILIYPEQSLWWNYRKPKPLKKGAFSMAAKNKVPVLPIFITMEDSPIYKDQDGYPVQEYTINVGKPIPYDKNENLIENTNRMMDTNYEVWKKVYEDFYGIPLTYTCENPPQNEK